MLRGNVYGELEWSNQGRQTRVRALCLSPDVAASTSSLYPYSPHNTSGYYMLLQGYTMYNRRALQDIRHKSDSTDIRDTLAPVYPVNNDVPHTPTPW